MVFIPFSVAMGCATYHLSVSHLSCHDFPQAQFNSKSPQEGFIREWTLMLHGTRLPPYSSLPVTDPHSKLAVVKKVHESTKSSI